MSRAGHKATPGLTLMQQSHSEMLNWCLTMMTQETQRIKTTSVNTCPSVWACKHVWCVIYPQRKLWELCLSFWLCRWVFAFLSPSQSLGSMWPVTSNDSALLAYAICNTWDKNTWLVLAFACSAPSSFQYLHSYLHLFSCQTFLSDTSSSAYCPGFLSQTAKCQNRLYSQTIVILSRNKATMGSLSYKGIQ